MLFLPRALAAAAVLLGSLALAAPGDSTGARLLDVRLVARPSTCAPPALPQAPAMTLPSCIPGTSSAGKDFGPLGRGRVRLRVSPDAAGGAPPTLDFKVALDLRDVRDHGAPVASGFLTLSLPVQVVGQTCSGASCPRLPVSVPCGASGGWAPGECRILTLFNAAVPGLVVDASGPNVAIGPVQVLDGVDVVFVQGP